MTGDEVASSPAPGGPVADAEVAGAPELPGERGPQGPAPDVPTASPVAGVVAFGAVDEGQPLPTPPVALRTPSQA
eukprot:14689205-Alexandrium_andersonii.AAC.1